MFYDLDQVGRHHCRYLLDVQPGLVNVLAATVSSNTDRFIQVPGRGLHAQQDSAGVWSWMVQDGLGSVRGELSDSLAVEGARSFAPYGTVFETQGAFETSYAFTGEPLDANGLVYLRMRYLSPQIGAFLSRDLFEGLAPLPMTLNGYEYVSCNPVNMTDPSGMCYEDQDNLEQCLDDARFLSDEYNVRVLWEDNVPDMCTNVAPDLGLTTSKLLPWTADEMQAVRNAFGIFDGAYNSIEGFGSRGDYQWPLTQQQSVNVIKQSTITSSTPDTAGITYYDKRTIAVNEAVWSNRDKLPNQQQQSWIVLHEFSHVFIQDVGIDGYKQSVLADEVTRVFGSLFPSAYAYSGKSGEYLIEAVTGTLWNYGYPAITGYDSSAGGRTGWNTLGAHSQSMTQFRLNKEDDILETIQYVINVRLNALGTLASETTTQDTLEKWVIRKILVPSEEEK